MLALVESRNAKIDAQRRLTACLERAWGSRETRVVVWRPASIQMPITHNGRYWFGSLDPNQDESTPKYWNPFGRYHQSGNLQIAVEINIPTESNSRRIAGFFAKDIETDVVYLMHDGGVGGGRQGVGRDPFLAWSSAKPEPVVDSHRALRLGIVVAPVDSRTTAGDIARFIQLVVDLSRRCQMTKQFPIMHARHNARSRTTTTNSLAASDDGAFEKSNIFLDTATLSVRCVTGGNTRLKRMKGSLKMPI
jgi:hypothetical protein